jgi:DNA (cytosine-5)-methyltransferase 1
MNRPKALDLFCGAGGASMGLYRAGFDVTGVDWVNQPRYPFKFRMANALHYPLEGFDFIWASPPCQGYMQCGMIWKTRENYPKLVEPIRERLRASSTPYVIENVPGAPVRRDLVLCGTMFGLGVRRHRLFEADGWLAPFVPMTCDHGRAITGVYGHGHGKGGAWRKGKRPMLPSSAEVWRREMGIDWMTSAEITQAIPPAYSEFIGKQAMRVLEGVT